MNPLADCHSLALIKTAQDRERARPALVAGLVGGGIAGGLGARHPAAIMGAEAEVIKALHRIKPLRPLAESMGRKFWERFGKAVLEPGWKTRLRYGGRAAAAGAILSASLAAMIGRKK